MNPSPPPPSPHFDLKDVPASPWKNGGGTTRELLSWPPGAPVFDWRVSVATIAASGPFSAFPDVARQIMLLSGDGVALRGAGIDHRLTQPFQPFAFDGGVPVEGTLLGGTSVDFNVMAYQAAGVATLQMLSAHANGAPLALAGAFGVALVLQGHWRLAGEPACAGQGVRWTQPLPDPSAQALTDGARLAWVQWHPFAQDA